jgi:hypothetical protein
MLQWSRLGFFLLAFHRRKWHCTIRPWHRRFLWLPRLMILTVIFTCHESDEQSSRKVLKARTQLEHFHSTTFQAPKSSTGAHPHGSSDFLESGSISWRPNNLHQTGGLEDKFWSLHCCCMAKRLVSCFPRWTLWPPPFEEGDK